MRSLTVAAAAAAACLLGAPTMADTLSIDKTAVRAGDSQSMPKRGMSMRDVERSYGTPIRRRSAIGDPPIARWEYPGYVVYFEYTHVIHAVLKRETSSE